MKKPNRKYSEKDRELIIEYFKINSDNRSVKIAEVLNYNRNYVDRVLTRYLNEQTEKKERI